MLLLSHLTASSRTWSWWPRSGATCAAHSPFEHGDARAPEETPTRQGPHATAEQWGGSLGGVWVLRPHVKLLSRQKRHGGKTFHSVECPGHRSWRVGSNSHGCMRRLCHTARGSRHRPSSLPSASWNELFSRKPATQEERVLFPLPLGFHLSTGNTIRTRLCPAVPIRP